MEGLGRNERTVRPGVWLLAAGSIVFLFVIILGLSFVKRVGSQDTAGAPGPGGPVGAQGRAVSDVVNPTGEPIQTMVADREPILWQEGDVTWHMNPRAIFIIAGRIVSSKSYQDWQSAFAPVDLLIAWGDLSNPEVDQWISWSQSGRAGRYHQSSSSPFTRNFLISHASNVHIIPATENLEIALMDLEPDEDALLAGLLVDVESNRGRVNTSLIRTDSGDGACEILYVERLVVDGMEYR